MEQQRLLESRAFEEIQKMEQWRAAAGSKQYGQSAPSIRPVPTLHSTPRQMKRHSSGKKKTG